MVKTDVCTAGGLPERLLKETVLVVVPCLEVVAEEAAGIAGVGVETPECVVDVVLYHIVTEKLHPLLVLALVHMTAPLTDEKRSYILLVDVSPCIAPVVVKESFC